MRMSRFERLLDAHGADLSRWPDADRAAGERLLAESAEARALVADAERLDRMLRDGLAAGAASARLRQAVRDIPLENPHKPAPVRGWSWSVGLAWGSGFAAVAASAVLGFVVGMAELPTAQPEPEADIAGLVYGPSFDRGDLL